MKPLLPLLFFTCLTGILVAQSESRIALVIGNSDYSEAPLRNPVNDAQALGRVLQDLGFHTIIRTNRGLRDLENDVNAFLDQIQRAKKRGNRTVACIYYSGHGMQIGGINYLIPINHGIKKQPDVKYKAYPADLLLDNMAYADADVNILILDACRNNPFERSLKGRVKDLFPELQEGLADVGTPAVGTLIAYATSPGQVATDGDDNNSPYAKALLQYLPQPGITIEQAFRRVRNAVYQATRETQTPWETSSLMGDDLYLKAAPQSRVEPIIADPPPPPSDIPPNMALVSGGSFRMGSKDGDDDEANVHQVTLSPFILDQYEITFAQYDAFCTATGRTKPDDEGWGRGQRPVINVSWYDAIEYCNWRSDQEGLQRCYTIDKSRKDPYNNNKGDDLKWTVTCNWTANGYRLPTEAEWEYAAGGGQSTPDKWSGTNIKTALHLFANYWESDLDGYENTAPVGAFQPNSLGLYDLSGNVWEWCWDWKADYPTANQRNPRGPNSGVYRVLRGGSWNDYADDARVAYRGNDRPNYRYLNVGFRCLRTY